jgi:hypothetical protein
MDICDLNMWFGILRLFNVDADSDLCTMCMWVMFSTFRRDMLPPLLGYKELREASKLSQLTSL